MRLRPRWLRRFLSALPPIRGLSGGHFGELGLSPVQRDVSRAKLLKAWTLLTQSRNHLRFLRSPSFIVGSKGVRPSYKREHRVLHP